MSKVREKMSLSKEIFDLEDILLKLSNWNDGLDFLVSYYSWRDPDLEYLLENYNATSALFWAFQRDFEQLTKECLDKLEEMMKKNSKKVKEIERIIEEFEL